MANLTTGQVFNRPSLLYEQLQKKKWAILITILLFASFWLYSQSKDPFIPSLLTSFAISVFITLFVTSRIDAAQRQADQERLQVMRENINKDVFDTVFKRIIPDKIFKTVKGDVILSNVCRNEFKLRFEFIEQKGGAIELRERTEYYLANITHENLTFPIKLNSRQGSRLIRATCEVNENKIQYDAINHRTTEGVFIEDGNPNNIVLTAQIPSEKSARIITEYSKHYDRYHTKQIAQEYFFKHPTTTASIEIIFPRTYDLEISDWILSLLHTHEKTETRRTFEFKKSVLPNVGFVFSIQKKEAPVQNMEALGIVTDNMIHNFNNQLHLIVNSLDLASSSLQSDAECLHYFEDVKKYLERFRGTLTTLKNYSDSTKAGGAPLKLSIAVNEAIKNSLPKSTVQIKQSYMAPLDTIMANRVQVRFVIISLIDKLCEFKDEGDCILELLLKNIKVDGRNWIQLEISRKKGVFSKKLCEKIAAEWKHNKRSSLDKINLNTLKEEVLKWHGVMTFSDKDPDQPVFEINFPVMEHEFHSESFDLDEFSGERGKNERILYVDDDHDISDKVKETLENRGYQVMRFINSQRALDRFRKNPDDFDLVITDMNMPNLSGISLGQQIKAIRDDIPVVISTGGDERIDDEKARELNFQHYITKPYSGNEISKVISTLLERGDRGES